MKKATLITITIVSLAIVSIGIVNMVISSPERQKARNTAYLQLKNDVVVIELLPKIAPNHVKRFRELVKGSFYNNAPFYRAVKGFIVQIGNSDDGKVKLKPEFSSLPFKRGTVAMARKESYDSADSDFFIVLQDSNQIGGQYTIFGQVTKGMEYLDNIKFGRDEDNGFVLENPDKIVGIKTGDMR